MTQLSELLRQIKDLEIKSKNLAEGAESGTYRSRFRGGGIEFSEVREYSAGDDIRRVDWNVSARYNDIFIKEFVEEKELNVYVIMDISSSNDFGFIKSKKDLAVEVGASLVFSAVKNNDRIGFGLFTDTLEKFIPAKKGKRQAIKILKEVTEIIPQSNKTDIFRSLSQLEKYLKKRSIVFIISDFISDSFVKPLKYLKSRHQIILVNIFDIREKNIPEIGNAFIEDIESGEQILVNTSDKRFQEEYSKLIKETKVKNENQMKKLGIDYINLSNEEPFDQTFNRHIKKRRI